MNALPNLHRAIACRLRPALLGLVLLCPVLGFAAPDEYPVRVVGAAPLDTLMLRAAREIARQPGFSQRYPPSHYLLAGSVYYWASGDNCMAVAGFEVIDLTGSGRTQSGNFSDADISGAGCPNAFVAQVVPRAAQRALQIFMSP
jgi:hypothetical protein